MHNYVFNLSYWNEVAKDNEFNRICSNHGKEEDFGHSNQMSKGEV